MTEHIISHWNSIVQPDDEVWIVGDVSMGNPDKMHGNISRLAGRKHLLEGNHDKKIMRDPELMRLFETINVSVTMDINGTPVRMQHHPIPVWDGKESGTVFLHGHLHSTNPEVLTRRKYDVGIDGHPNFSLYILDELIAELTKIDPTIRDIEIERPDYAKHNAKH